MEYSKKIDSYNVTDSQSDGTKVEERLRDVDITYYSDGNFFASSPTYTRVPEEKVVRIKEKLFDYTVYNLNVDCLTKVIPFLTIVNEVERIIFDK